MRLLILLLFLTACTAPPPVGPLLYRTTEGGTPLPWTLSIWPPNKSGPPKQLTQANPGGVDAGFRWQLSPNGDTVQLEFTGRNDLIALPPRAVVDLDVDGQHAFYGVVPDPPSTDSPDAEALQVLGGREALRLTLMDGTVYRNQGVYQIVRDLLARLTPPALTYSAALIGDGTGTDAGPTLGTYYSPTADLVTALDALAKSAGASWGVDAQGRVFFGQPQPAALTVAYAGQPWRRLRVQGRETVTRAVLRVVSAASEGVDGYTSPGTGFGPYLPATITKVAELPLHGVYLAARAVEPPKDVSVVRDHRTGQVSSSQMTNTAAAFDGDDATAATSTGTLPSLALEASGVRAIGVRLRYSLRGPDGISARLRLFHLTKTLAEEIAGQIGPLDELGIDLPPAQDERTLTVLMPPSSLTADTGIVRSLVDVGVKLAPVGTNNPLTISELSLLVVDEDAALRVAQSFLQAPFAAPAEITLPGLQAPTPSVTVTGSPDGTVTGPTGLWEYEHSPTAVRSTRVRLGSTGQDDTVRALRWAVRP